MTLTKSHVAGPTTPAVREMTFGDLLRKAAESAPDRLALIAGVPDPKLRRQWTYAQFYREAQRTARALLSRFKPGERIAVWAQNIPEWMMLEFGAGMAGMVLVTVNPAFRAREVEYVLKQSRSAGVFVVNSFRGNPMLETVQEVAPNCPELREIICFDDWNNFIAAGDDESIKLPAVSPDDPVMIQYTSGTTGFPKGALLRHRGLLNNGADTADRMGVDPGDVFVTTDAAVSHRRLRLLRDRRGVEGRDAGAGRGIRARPGARNARRPIAAMRCSAFPPCWSRCWSTRHFRPPISRRSRRSARAAPRFRPRWSGSSRKSSAPPSPSCSARPNAPRSRRKPAPPTASRTRPTRSACRCPTWKPRSSTPTPARPFRSARSANSAPAAIT